MPTAKHRVQVSFTMDRWLDKDVIALCKYLRMSRSALLEMIVAMGLQEWYRQSDMEATLFRAHGLPDELKGYGERLRRFMKEHEELSFAFEAYKQCYEERSKENVVVDRPVGKRGPHARRKT